MPYPALVIRATLWYIKMYMTSIDTVVKQYRKKNAPVLRPGFVVRVSEKIVEGGKERVQIFEGLVLSVKHGKGMDGMFTVRKIASGRIGVERTFPLHMLFLEKIEVLREEKVRRAKLYFIREQINKKTKKRKTQERNNVFDLTVRDQDDIAGKNSENEQEKDEVSDKSNSEASQENNKETKNDKQQSAKQNVDSNKKQGDATEQGKQE